MSRGPQRILLVEPDPDLVELLCAALTKRLAVHVTCVSDAPAALDSDLCHPHDLVISESQLPSATGVELVERLMILGRRPVIFLTEEQTFDGIWRALRVGVRHVFPKPFPIAGLLEAAERALEAVATRQVQRARYRRLRTMVREVIRERREMSQRLDLVSRDLVHAYRRLVDRISPESEADPTNPTSPHAHKPT